MLGLFSDSNFLIVIIFRSPLGSREKEHTILKRAALFQKEIATQGGRQNSSGVLEVLTIVPTAVLSVIYGPCSLAA